MIEVQWHSLWTISQEIAQPPITNISFKITQLDFYSNLSVITELIDIDFYLHSTSKKLNKASHSAS